MTANPTPLLDDLLAQLDLTEAALREGQAEALRAQAEALAQAILVFQRDFAALAPEARGQPDWPIRLGAIDTRLRLLQQQLQVQSGSVQRALGTLFPAEQGNAYARLGGKAPMGGRPRVSNNTSLKA